MSTTVRVLHAGLHKTGSTYLQKEFFPRLQDCIYFHGYDFSKGPEIDSGHQPRVILFSSEASCGLPYPDTPMFSANRLITNVTALRIDKVFLFQRDFDSWVLSLYMQSLKAGRWWSLEEFISRNNVALQSWRNATNIIASQLADISVEFSSFNTRDLAERPQQTCDQVCAFIGVDPVKVDRTRSNVSLYGTKAINYYRFMNRLGDFRLMRPVYRALHIRPLGMMKASKSRLGFKLNGMSRTFLGKEQVRALLEETSNGN